MQLQIQFFACSYRRLPLDFWRKFAVSVEVALAPGVVVGIGKEAFFVAELPDLQAQERGVVQAPLGATGIAELESVRLVVATVAKEWGLSPADVTGRTRGKHEVAARHVAICICSNVLGLNQVTIGNHFGMTHTAVSYAVNGSQHLLETPEARRAERSIRRRAGQISTTYDHRGFARIHDGIETQKEFFELFEDATSIELMLITGRRLLHEYIDVLRDRVQKDCSIRISLSHYQWSTEHSALCPGVNLSKEVFKTLALLDHYGLLRSPGNQTEIRLRRSPPTCNMVFVNDEDVLVTPFIPYAETDVVPSFQYHKVSGGWYAQYRASFEAVWLDSEPIPPDWQRPAEPGR